LPVDGGGRGSDPSLFRVVFRVIHENSLAFWTKTLDSGRMEW
jgi:hypothetical protein